MYVFETPVNSANEKVFVETILKYTNDRLNCEVWVSPRAYDLNFKYLKINYFQEIG